MVISIPSVFSVSRWLLSFCFVNQPLVMIPYFRLWVNENCEWEACRKVVVWRRCWHLLAFFSWQFSKQEVDCPRCNQGLSWRLHNDIISVGKSTSSRIYCISYNMLLVRCIAKGGSTRVYCLSCSVRIFGRFIPEFWLQESHHLQVYDSRMEMLANRAMIFSRWGTHHSKEWHQWGDCLSLELVLHFW